MIIFKIPIYYTPHLHPYSKTVTCNNRTGKNVTQEGQDGSFSQRVVINVVVGMTTFVPDSENQSSVSAIKRDSYKPLGKKETHKIWARCQELSLWKCALSTTYLGFKKYFGGVLVYSVLYSNLPYLNYYFLIFRNIFQEISSHLENSQ